MCDLTWQKGLGRRDLVQDLETGVRLEYSGGPNINTRILQSEEKREKGVRGRCDCGRGQSDAI